MTQLLQEEETLFALGLTRFLIGTIALVSLRNIVQILQPTFMALIAFDGMISRISKITQVKLMRLLQDLER